MNVPKSADIAKVLPAALAEAGGSITLAMLEETLQKGSKFRIAGMSSEQQTEYLREALGLAVETLIRTGSAENRDERIFLTDRGWAQAEQLGVSPSTNRDGTETGVASDGHGGVIIDMSRAAPMIQLARQDGTIVTGFLRDGASVFHGRPFSPSAAKLIDDLYRAEVDGVEVPGGFYTALKGLGVSRNAVELLQTKCNIELRGYVPEQRAPRSDVIADVKRRGRPGRRPGISWERLVCEVIGELGGHAEWQAIADAVGHHTLAQQYQNWREEARQALRNHTTPNGRGYFEVAELGDRRVITLTEQGDRLAARRSEDDRAPTMSKLLAKVIAQDGDTKLTSYELYALFHLAVELGKPTEAEAIHHRLPENFPDEDRYYLTRTLIGRARELQARERS